MIRTTEIDELRELAISTDVIPDLHLWNLHEIVVPTELTAKTEKRSIMRMTSSALPGPSDSLARL